MQRMVARIIEEPPDEVGLYQFTHAQMKETLTSELSANRLVRMHARIAEALEEHYGDETEEHAAELAEHFGEAETILGDDKMVRYSRIAGERELGSYAFDEAVTHFERAILARRNLPITEGIAALYKGLGVSYAALRNVDKSVELAIAALTTAFDYYVKVGNMKEVARLGRFQFVSQEGQLGMMPMMEHALAIVPEDSIEAGWILAEYGRAVGSYGDFETGRDALRRALGIADRIGDDALAMTAHGNAGFVDRFNLELESAEFHEDRAIDLSTTTQNPLVESMSHLVRAMRYNRAGERIKAKTEATLALEAAHRSGDKERLATVTLMYQTAAFYYGDWDQSRLHGKTALEYWPTDPRVLALLALTEFHTGNYQAGQVLLTQYQELDTGLSAEEGGMVHSASAASIYPEIARITGKASYLGRAEQAANRLTGLNPTHTGRMVGHTAMAWKAIWEADHRDAETLYKKLGQIGGVYWAYGYRMGYATMPGMLGLLASVAERFEECQEQFAKATTMCRTAGHRPYLAWTCSDHADILLERNAPGDREKAIELQDEAISIATELGMKPLLERVLAKREILKA